MNRYKISRIGISNFKIFSAYFEKSFKDDDLVVFDGPNGFGKTSLFDAIELALTGMIKRLDIYDDMVKNRQKSYSFPFINNTQNDFYIKLELSSSDGSLIICRSLKKELFSQKDKGSLKWERIKVGKLNSWEDDFTSASDLTQESLEGLLGIKDLRRIFNIFFYVQQEENTFFLKRSETERKEYLNILFDVDQESRFVEKIKKFSRLQKEYKEEMDLEIKKIEAKKVKVEASSTDNKISYEKLFLDTEVEWDKENPDFALLTYSNVIQGLSDIENLHKSTEPFKTQKDALKIKTFLTSPNFSKNYLLFKNYHEKSSKIEIASEIGKMLKNILQVIDVKYIDVDFWNSKKSFLESHFKTNFQEYIDIISSYVIQKGSYDNLEKLKTELNNNRKYFSESYSKYVVLDDKNKEDCPLCGHTWSSLEELNKAIIDSEKRFMTSGQALIQGIHDKIIEKKNLLKTDIKKRLDESYFPDVEVLSALRISAKGISNFSALDNFIKKYPINYVAKHELKTVQDLENLDIESNNFKEALENKINELVTLDESLFTRQESILQKYFNDSCETLEQFEVVKLKNKVSYIRIRYIEYSSVQNKELDQQIKKLKDEIEAVKEKVDKIKSIQDIYDSKIKGHITRIINDISIPFYINSGRILQEFHGGNGIFVKMGSQKSEGVKFYSDIDTENDPLYSLSSGQISSLVLAFCLTLNDVYRDHYLGMILIDDPIQTMDEINTITFIDLIRNNFKDRQFIISTHEESFSALVRYKFKQNNAKVSVLRMKDAF